MTGKKLKSNMLMIILYISIGLFAVYLGVVLVNIQVDIVVKNQEQADLQQAISRQATENEEIERLINNDDEAEYMEQLARDEYGYSLPDERVFVDIQGQ